MDESKADSENHASGSTTMPTKNSNRKRLHQNAIAILEDYFQQVSQNPSTKNKEALLKKIKAIPGCLDYDSGRLSGWFTSRRKRLRMKEQKKHSLPSDSNDSRFPSLTPAAIQHLTVLASNQLHPSSELLKTWTALLASSGAVEQDVINWIHYRNQHTPPTPSDTSQGISPVSPPPAYKQEIATSPTALQLSHPDEHEHEAPVTPSEPSSPNNELNQHIIHGVRDALASTQTTVMPNEAAPKTAADFEALFSPFEKKMLLLLRTLEST